jgi:ATP-dependent Clp protease ATP-binding subunit ClpB
LDNLKKVVAKQEIELEFSPQLIEWLSETGFDPEFGARPLKRVIKKKVMHALSKEILANNIKSGTKMLVDVFDDTVVFRTQVSKSDVNKVEKAHIEE